MRSSFNTGDEKNSRMFRQIAKRQAALRASLGASCAAALNDLQKRPRAASRDASEEVLAVEVVVARIPYGHAALGRVRRWRRGIALVVVRKIAQGSPLAPHVGEGVG